MRFFITFLLTYSTLFGIIDQPLQKPDFKNERKSLNLASNYPAFLETNTSSDDKNIFLYSKHFRVIYGKSYSSSVILKNLAVKILEYAEKSWSVEVEYLGFQQPNGSDKYFIDIYIGNKSSYNYSKNSYMNIGSNYAGFASYYSNATPYFVLNPSIDNEIIKVTIAHEFFHTIQYSYFNGDEMSDEIWFSNLWFLEGTAVFMEDEVFPENNDYANLVRHYTNTIYKPLDYFNGSAEYGKSIFFKFLKEKNGDISIIEKSLQMIDEKTKFLDLIERNIEDFQNIMAEFGTWIINPKEHFEDGKLYPIPTLFELNSNVECGKYGFLFLSNSSKYILSSNIQYLQRDFLGEKNRVHNNDFFVMNLNSKSLSTKILQKNIYRDFEIKKGWNMFGNSFANDLLLEEIFSESQFLWIFRDRNFVAFSKDMKFKKEIEKISSFSNLLKSGEGAWIFSTEDRNISLNEKELIDFSKEFSSEFELKSFLSSSIESGVLRESFQILYFDNFRQTWKIYNRGDSMSNVDFLENIEPFKGYFIRKD